MKGFLRFALAASFALVSLGRVAADDGVDLTVLHGAAPGEVRLEWTGGLPGWSIYRGTTPNALPVTGLLLGATSDRLWFDTPPAGEIHYYKVVGPCTVSTAEGCDGEDNDCDSHVDEGCGSACASDAECPTIEFCGGGLACQPDEINGGSCSMDSQCMSGHCSNGACCDSGDCCAVDATCAFLSEPAVCDSGSTCQGSRVQGICSAFQCQAEPVPDDSACAGTVSSTCGPYPSIACTGADSQPSDQASLCASTCSLDTQCDPAAHCDESKCTADLAAGASCDETTDCASGFCVDGVCCASSCQGTCESCGLAGSAGTCAAVPLGTDPDGECGAVSCGAYYWGWAGDVCYRKADVSSSQATCSGSRSCQTTSQQCTQQTAQGSAALACDATCQDPIAGTCSGTTIGACANVNPGTQTCGLGICQVTTAQCVNGTPNTCVPGAAGSETCNDLDDNCDGTVDNNASFADGLESNDSCATFRTLSTVGSNQTLGASNITLYPSGDVDHFRIPASETDSSCGCCDFFCTDEDYRLTISLTVPAGAGSYLLCASLDCASVGTNCVTVPAGSSGSRTFLLDGACGATVDSYSAYVRISPGNAPGYECRPYTLSYNFQTACN
jgi:hypothetical protein